MLKRAAAEKGVMGTLVGAGVGGASYFAAAKLAPKVSFLASRWWATPTALLVAGHLVKRYSQETGQAVVGASGALLAFSYYVQSATPVTTTTTTRAAPASGLGVGVGEAGYVVRGGWGAAGALQQAGALSQYHASRTSAYRRSPAGALVA